jgi:hypothetical protein
MIVFQTNIFYIIIYLYILIRIPISVFKLYIYIYLNNLILSFMCFKKVFSGI